MRKILAIGLAIVAAVACRPSGGKDLATETREYEKSASHADLSIKVELPAAGQGAAASSIRKTLVGVMDELLSHIGSYEEERLFPAYEGDTDKTDLLLEYYRDKALESITTATRRWNPSASCRRRTMTSGSRASRRTTASPRGSGRRSSTRCPAGSTSSTS